MTIKTMGPRALTFVLSEAAGTLSRDEGDVALSQTISPGQVLAVLSASAGVTVTAAARSTNTGSSGALTLASPAYTAKAKPGVYTVVCVEPATNAGAFRVEDPSGKEIGTATVGVAFAKEVKFTIADATDFVVGDAFDITVDEGADDDDGEEYVELDVAAATGAEVAVAIACYGRITDSSTKQRIVTIRRLAEVNGNDLIWPAGITDAQKSKAIGQLKKSHILVR